MLPRINFLLLKSLNARHDSYSKKFFGMKIYSNFEESLQRFSPPILLSKFILFSAYSTFFAVISCVVFVTPSAFAEPLPKKTQEVDAVAPEIPGPTPLPSATAPPTDQQLVPPPEGNEDKTRNVNTAVPDTGPDPGPTPSSEGVPPGPPTAADPNALIPAAEVTPTPAVSLKDAEAQQKALDSQELAKYKAAKIQAEKVPAIRSLYERAQRAPTDEDYRAAMREYYRMLFKKIERLEPSLADKARGMQEAYLRRLAQTRIEPTIPLHPPPTPVPLSP
ncbi:MAG: hypothetical protein C5B47_06275 [Verrucomicrobia bacterium]|nr:MAG: hypothetical protein C5B47_06275 [Verrucomicrobiota bacterium]